MRLLRGSFAETFVIFADEVGVTWRDGIAVDGDEGVAGFAAGQFVGDTIANLKQGFHDLKLNDGPIGFLPLFVVLLPQQTRPLARGGNIVAQVGNFDQFFNIAEAIAPGCVAASSQRALLQRIFRIQNPVEVPGAAAIAACCSAPAVIDRLIEGN